MLSDKVGRWGGFLLFDVVVPSCNLRRCAQESTMERRTVRGCKAFEEDDGTSNECCTAVCNALVALRMALG